MLKIFNMAVCKRTVLDNLRAQEELNQKLDTLLQHQTFVRWNLLDDIQHFEKYNNESLLCPLCEFTGKKENFPVYRSSCIFQGGDLIRFQCPSCELIFGSQKMLALTEEALCQDYEWHYRTYSEGDSTEQEVRAFHMLEPKREGIYLNYGSGGWSRSLSELRKKAGMYGHMSHIHLQIRQRVLMSLEQGNNSLQ